jgi:hypothetical protein
MFICAAGDIHGAMDRLYDDVLAFEEALGVRFDYVLHVGDTKLPVLRRSTNCWQTIDAAEERVARNKPSRTRSR